jgi:hypothetical protein
MEEIRHAYKFFVGDPKRKRSCRKPKHRWEVGIRMGLSEVEWGIMDWIHLAQGRDAVAGSYEHGNEASGPIRGGTFLDWVRRSLLHGVS